MTTSKLITTSRLLIAFVSAAFFLTVEAHPHATAAFAAGGRASNFNLKEATQETGFLNRKIELHGVTYRFQVYLPEDYSRDDKKQWPIILFLHGRGERGSEGMWQTQFGLPQAVRDHPSRWQSIIVMPQCPLDHYWTDPEMLAVAMAALDRETAEFHADTKRTYLTGLSMGGYGSWELARLYPQRWAAMAIASSGIFWSYAPERLQQSATLPVTYAKPTSNIPIWLFHGTDDNVVVPLQSEVMYEAVKKENGNIRLWLYKGLQHDSWTRAYDEPTLPAWLFAQRAGKKPAADIAKAFPNERIVIPIHPAPIKLTSVVADALIGEYRSPDGKSVLFIYRKGDQYFQKDPQGGITEIAPESPTSFFYPTGSSTSRLIFERDAQGRITTIIQHEDRRELRWEKHPAITQLNIKPTSSQHHV